MEDRPWLEAINQNIQQLLSQSALRGREVELRGLPDLSLEIIVDGKAYQSLDEIPDVAVRDLIQAAIDEWQDEVEAATLLRAASSARRPVQFRNGIGMVAWLVAVVLIFVLPPMFVTPIHTAMRFSLAWAGGMLGGLIGSLGGRAIARRVVGSENPRALILWELLGGGLAVPLGFFITISILSVVP
ncbi:MAG: hypothetical protein JXA14_18300 [Anaerolineae bacterium]|nr:hypothetical protein [Anaerolineae bacterium]